MDEIDKPIKCVKIETKIRCMHYMYKCLKNLGKKCWSAKSACY